MSIVIKRIVKTIRNEHLDVYACSMYRKNFKEEFCLNLLFLFL